MLAPSSVGLVLALVTLAQAQGEATQDLTARVPDPRNDILIIGQEAPRNVNELVANVLQPQQQLGYFVYQEKPDAGSGLTVLPVDEAARTHLKIPKGRGLIVTWVVPHGPAARAGICQNDILLTLDDVPLAKPEDLEERLKAAGDKALSLELLHVGQKKTLQVRPMHMVIFGPVQPATSEFWIGISVTPLEPALRDQLQIAGDRGLLTTGVVKDSPAAKAGFKLNDILLTINSKPIIDQVELIKLVQTSKERPLAIEILREGSGKTIEVTPERRKDSILRTAKDQLSGNFNIVRPGAVFEGGSLLTPELSWTAPKWVWSKDWNSWSKDWNSAHPQADAVASRLDTMAGEIKDLRKAVEKLSEAVKDRK
jgi:membrane-associated protease RseP (regulator of RpoE activity)